MIDIKTATECHDKTFRYGNGRMVHSVCSQTQDHYRVREEYISNYSITIVAINIIRVLN